MNPNFEPFEPILWFGLYIELEAGCIGVMSFRWGLCSLYYTHIKWVVHDLMNLFWCISVPSFFG